ncbi:MAG: flagellar export chaperone FlgN [Desulfobacula sp.]|uniref:flagellar export chaperone FlgN n=1 Tax=Desulfobacula sp. TaxID=2593537 RepID=UPI0025C1A765|nr:flagellar export chaperone FlgN [Desulfobacula sp.]MCD4722830.1 flagellar export chaperone FlgN [Desulfobacula sp.]
MENFTPDIEDMLNEKLDLYKQLNAQLKQERKFIVDIDVDSLWKSSEKKKKITKEIQALRGKILYHLDEMFCTNDMDIRSFSVSYLIRTIPAPKELKTKFRKIKLAIENEKKELAQVALENKKYVTEYLSVIDDVMSIAVDNSKQAQYDLSGAMPGSKNPNCLIHAEV